MPNGSVCSPSGDSRIYARDYAVATTTVKGLVNNVLAPVLFVLLALGGRSTRSGWFAVAAAWGIAWNLFGAATFDRAAYDHFYFREGTQQILYQAD